MRMSLCGTVLHKDPSQDPPVKPLADSMVKLTICLAFTGLAGLSGPYGSGPKFILYYSTAPGTVKDVLDVQHWAMIHLVPMVPQGGLHDHLQVSGRDSGLED